MRRQSTENGCSTGIHDCFNGEGLAHSVQRRNWRLALFPRLWTLSHFQGGAYADAVMAEDEYRSCTGNRQSEGKKRWTWKGKRPSGAKARTHFAVFAAPFGCAQGRLRSRALTQDPHLNSMAGGNLISISRKCCKKQTCTQAPAAAKAATPKKSNACQAEGERRGRRMPVLSIRGWARHADKLPQKCFRGVAVALPQCLFPGRD